MRNDKVKQLGPNSILNQYIETDRDLIRRFVKLDYPVYSLPVEVTERSAEPYEEIERNIEKLLFYTEINGREALYNTMGIGNFRNLGDNTLDYLISILHVEENNGVLSLTNLARQSLQENYKIKLEKSARLIYFDALSLHPLPKKYYKPKEAIFISPLDVEEFKSANVIDIWEFLPQENIKGLLDMNGMDRLEYNMPQEMVDIKIDETVLQYDREQIMSKGVIQYIPLYIVVAEEESSFMNKMGRSSAIGSMDFMIYSGVSGKREEFFENLLKKNFAKAYYIFGPLIENFNILVDNEVGLWAGELAAKIDISRFGIEKDGNLTLKVSAEDIDFWIENSFERPIKDAAYSNLVPLWDKNHHGRIVRLKMEKRVVEKAQNYLIDKQVKRLKDEEKSEEYIKKEMEKMKSRFVRT